MAATDDLQRILRAAEELAAPTTIRLYGEARTFPGHVALRKKVGEYRRAGLPSASWSEGSRSAEHPLPEFDKADKMLAGQLYGFDSDLRLAANLLEAALRKKNAVLNIEEPLPDPVVIPCGNLAHADGVLEPGRLSGRCSMCRKHWSRYGVEWPNKPAEGAA